MGLGTSAPATLISSSFLNYAHQIHVLLHLLLGEIADFLMFLIEIFIEILKLNC
jgi:hypothetical protein